MWKQPQILITLWLAGVVGIAQPAWGKNKSSDFSSNIVNLKEFERPATSVKQWLSQATTPVTGISINNLNGKAEIILETNSPDKLQIINRSQGNNFIAEIVGGQLRLSDGDSFRQEKPITGIKEITAINQNSNTIRITVVGETGVPKAELFDTNKSLILSVTPISATAENPNQGEEQREESQPQKPTSETPAKKPTQDDVIELVVTGQQNQGYNPDNATTGTRTDTPTGDVPQSIQVIPREVIEDQGAINITEALRNVPGIVPTNSARTLFTVPFIRGFGGFGSINDLFRRNGLRDTLGTSNTGETADVERIEVLRGPASVLYGQGSLGGTVNIVTKQPLREPFYKVEASAGNYDFYRGTVDLSGPINDSKSLLYRLNVAAETAGSFIDFYDRDRYLIAPVLSWQMGENTKLTVEGEYRNIQNPNDFGLPAQGTVLDNPNGDIPINRYIGEPSLEGRRDIESYRIGYNFEHQFSENWKLRNAFDAVLRKSKAFNIIGLGVEPDGRTFRRRYFDGTEGFDNNSYTVDTYAVGNFNTGNVKHKLVTGIELFRDEAIRNNEAIGSLSPIDLFNPQYGNATVNPPTRIRDSKETKDGLGIYVQDQISFSDNLIFVLGGRFDIINVTNEDFINSTTDFQQDEAFSPRVGVVYKPIPNISLYGSYSRSFQQETGRAFDNSLFKPQHGTQYEIGVKADLNDRVSATLALYDLTRSNVLTEDPDNPGFDIQTGKQNSQGVELNLAGELAPGWNITAGYAYNDARITEDNSFDEGNRLNNAPENAFSLWTTYQIQKGSMQGLGFGLGLFYVGERQGDLANTFSLPSYLRTDAAIFYQKNDFRAAINIRNLLDINYFETSQNALRVYPGDPLTVVGSVSWKF